MNWTSIIIALIAGGCGVAGGSVGTAIVNGVFRKPKDQADTTHVATQSTAEAARKWQELSAHYEERLNDSEKTGRKLAEQLQKSEESHRDTRAEMQQLRLEIRAGVEVFKRCMPMLERVADATELLELSGAIKRFQRLGTTKRGR